MKASLLHRVVEAELLDGLAAQDPAAQRARRDLQRVHRAMGTRSTVLRALRGLGLRRHGVTPGAPLQVLELGAGDGTLMLGVARALHADWPPVALTLLDRQDLLQTRTAAGYAAVGWAVTTQVGDVHDWVADDGSGGSMPGGPLPLRPQVQPKPRWDLILAHLFLHHFTAAPLAGLLAAVAARSDHFVTVEPRRAWPAWAGSHLVGALGVNAVTRQDAVLSVQAGFRDQELRALWPGTRADGVTWTLREYPAGPFSHALTASRGSD